MDRLPACVLTAHAWLHIPDFMEKSGPLWAFWCWVMERMCSRLVRGVSSKKHPNASLDRRTLEYANLTAIVNAHDLQQVLPTFTRIYATSRITTYRFDYEDYESLTLSAPTRTVSINTPEGNSSRSKKDKVPNEMMQLRRRIAVHLSAQWGPTALEILKANVLPSTINVYARVEIQNGDTIRSFFGGHGDPTTSNDGRRDATFFQYELWVDRYAHQPRRKPVFVRRTFFGRLNRIITFECSPLGKTLTAPRGENRPFVLLDVDPCKATRDTYGFYQYNTFDTAAVIDAKCAQAVVGRIPEGNGWVFVQRNGAKEQDYRDFSADDLDDVIG